MSNKLEYFMWILFNIMILSLLPKVLIIAGIIFYELKNPTNLDIA